MELNELQNSKSHKLGDRIIFHGIVVDNSDLNANGTIKVRLDNIDKTIADKDLPPCYSLLNLNFFYKLPQKGERVSIILDRKYNADSSFNQEKRYWIDTASSSPLNLNNEQYFYSANSHESDGFINPVESIKNIPSAIGTYPNNEDVALRGRKNTDIVFKNGEILIRSGRHNVNNIRKFNDKNTSYIQISHEKLNVKTINEKEKTIIKSTIIPPKTQLNLFIADLSVTLKVIDKKTNTTVEQYSNTFLTLEVLTSTVKEKIFEYQNKYKQWELVVPINAPEPLKQLSPIYPNNRKIQRTKIKEKSNPNNSPNDKYINIVANKINLLSHLNSSYQLNNPENQISIEEQKKIHEQAHPLVYGDKLIELLNLFKQYIVGHKHPYTGMPVVQDQIVKKIINFNLNDIIDENIRIG